MKRYCKVANNDLLATSPHVVCIEIGDVGTFNETPLFENSMIREDRLPFGKHETTNTRLSQLPVKN